MLVVTPHFDFDAIRELYSREWEDHSRCVWSHASGYLDLIANGTPLIFSAWASSRLLGFWPLACEAAGKKTLISSPVDSRTGRLSAFGKSPAAVRWAVLRFLARHRRRFHVALGPLVETDVPKVTRTLRLFHVHARAEFGEVTW